MSVTVFVGVDIDNDIDISIGIGIVIDFFEGFSLGLKWLNENEIFWVRVFHMSNWQKVQLNTDLFSDTQKYLSANQMAWSKDN